MQILGIVFIIIAGLGIATGAILALFTWLIAIFTLTACILNRQLRDPDWITAGRMFLASLISLAIGGAFGALHHILNIKF